MLRPAGTCNRQHVPVTQVGLTRNTVLGDDDLGSLDCGHNVLSSVHMTQHDCCGPTVLIPGNNWILHASNVSKSKVLVAR